MKKRRSLFWLIIVLSLGSIFIDLPKNIPIKFAFKNFKIDWQFSRPEINWHLGEFKIYRDLEIKKGIDLAGGTHLVFQADMSQVSPDDQQAAIEAARDNIEKRVNLFGVSEPVIQTSKVGNDYRLLVELAGITDIDQAITLIGQTAQLDFRELPEEATETASFADFQHSVRRLLSRAGLLAE